MGPSERRASAPRKEVAVERRDFLVNAGCAAAGLVAGPLPASAEAAPGQAAGQQTVPRQYQRRVYSFEVEIFEVKSPCGFGHKAGDKFPYPQEKGKICSWLMDAMNAPIRVLECGGTMPWLYEGTPYKKVIDPDGVTTEFIRCPDPTTGVVAKITRRRV
jgi:uncharacterized repeat protein (TIGR04076 family)